MGVKPYSIPGFSKALHSSQLYNGRALYFHQIQIGDKKGCHVVLCSLSSGDEI